jgi:hypothetical protein
MTAVGHKHDPVTIADRRELPFFMVYTRAVEAIREHTAGPRRVRTIGFYGLLCQLANEQRNIGQQRRVRYSYDLLAARGGVSKGNIAKMLTCLEQAGVLRRETQPDPERGGSISIAHLLIHEHSFIAVTVPMADRLAAPRDGGHLLRDLGLIVVLLEFCVRQGPEGTWTQAQVTRSQIAEHSGLHVDRVDDCHRILEAAGLLTIERRRPTNGGRNLPSIYTIHEAPLSQGGETELAASGNETSRAADRNGQGGKTELAGRPNETGRAAEQNGQGGNAATGLPDSPPSSTRAADADPEEQRENFQGGQPEPVDGTLSVAYGTSGWVIEAFIDAWKPALGSSPAIRYGRDKRRWHEAADRLLERLEPDRIAAGFTQMVGDPYIGGKATTLPDFDRIAEELIAKHFATADRGRHGTAFSPAGDPRSPDESALSWPAAKDHLARAIQRHGRDHRAAALAELGAIHPTLERFVLTARWTALCEHPLHYSERQYRDLWSELTERDNDDQERAAA